MKKLIQEAGVYNKSLEQETPRWVDEMSSFAGPSKTLYAVLAESLRTAFIRLLGVGIYDNEEDHRYYNAFQKFFMARLLDEEQPLETEDRLNEENHPLAIVKRAKERNYDLAAAVDRLQVRREYADLESWGDIMRLMSIQLTEQATNVLKTRSVPHEGSMLGHTMRPSAIETSIRMSIEECLLNYIKHAEIVRNIEAASLVIDAKIDSTLRVALRFVNNKTRSSQIIDYESHVPLSPSSETAGSIGIGIQLCDYILKNIGGEAIGFWKEQQQDIKHDWINKIIGNEPDWQSWYAIELNIPGRRF